MEPRLPLPEEEVGIVTHYWTDLAVAGVVLSAPLDVGDHIRIVGHTTDFEQDVFSMQVDHEEVLHADAGAHIGLKVAEHAREHDRVFKLSLIRDVGTGQSAL